MFMSGSGEERRDPRKICYFPLKFFVNIKLLKKSLLFKLKRKFKMLMLKLYKLKIILAG